MTPERIAGIGFVLLLHVIAIWAIVNGLAQKIVKAVEPPPIVATIDKIKQPVVKPPTLPPVELKTTLQPQVPKPDINIQPERAAPQPIAPVPLQPQPPQNPGIPDSAVSGIMSTHTTPPYPAVDRRFGNQGTVKLRLTISPQGIVTAADIVQSSGFAGLDQAAMSWVMQHWKYKPALQGGVPVASTAVAAVVFNIRNAG
jgi:protein TonB